MSYLRLSVVFFAVGLAGCATSQRATPFEWKFDMAALEALLKPTTTKSDITAALGDMPMTGGSVDTADGQVVVRDRYYYNLVFSDATRREFTEITGLPTEGTCAIAFEFSGEQLSICYVWHRDTSAHAFLYPEIVNHQNPEPNKPVQSNVVDAHRNATAVTAILRSPRRV